MITGSQLRAARGLLNLSVSELAAQTGLAINTIRRAEGTSGPAPITVANMNLLAATFDAAGVVFIPAGEQGFGVRFKSPDVIAHQPRRKDAR